MVGVPAPGHVHPSLGIIRELVARGHRVSYANDPRCAEVIAATGARLVPYASSLPSVTGSAWPDDPVEQLDLFLTEAMTMLPQLRTAYERDRPDLFLYDQAGVAARVLARAWNVPIVQISSTFVVWEGYEQQGPLARLRRDPRGAAHFRRYAAWLAGQGFAGTDPVAFTLRPDRCVVPLPPYLQPRAREVDPRRYTFVGPCLDHPVGKGTWTRPEGAERVLLISLGSLFTDRPDFYRQCLAAFGGLPGWHVVLQIGDRLPRRALGTVPGNVEVRRWVPQRAVLEHCDAFLTHAGMGGTVEGLYHGVPMIAVPQAADQFANADAIVRLGAGRRVDTGEATAEVLRETLLALVDDPGTAARLAAVGAELRRDDGTARAADLVEAQLAAGQPFAAPGLRRVPVPSRLAVDHSS
ncbi:macrolide family glycosyltransferase [Streptomyces sp. UNOC14_S4]|uniref:macrolide family glycosyltransferase n=1 Tax=Streptomyces sp. UNOC14_S4 TaxID=2872340 RepID=UPI001E5C4F80|nr:macrolide family glycosyltransferase [Streptomyces sp. UNOC14_S4]MCC3768804.1 glycosyl transferase [Streptomyces sp. UNOC14_S4]